MQNFPLKDDQMTTNFAFVDSSERAKTIDADGTKAQIGIEKYPWRSLPVGKSFFVDTKENEVKLQTMQSAASRWSKKLNRKFRVIKWPNGIEVARLPMSEVKASFIDVMEKVE
jgi:hypothetical protein